jgi:hypothetical protein
MAVLPSVGQDLTASVTGKVQDVTSVVVPGVVAELRSPGKEFRTRADSNGVCRFSELPQGEYTLKLQTPGFNTLTIKSIPLSEGEQKSIQVLDLAIGGMCGNDYIPWPEYYHLLASASRVGNLVGSVAVEPGPTVSRIRPVSGAEVSLICAEGIVCRKTKTDSKGAFVFMGLSPGKFTLHVDRAGFYPATEPS